MTEPESSKSLAARLQSPAFALTLLSAITFLIYCGTLSYEFVWDDVPQIVDNPLIRSWHNIPRVFHSDLWYHTARGQSYYRPLFIVWEILNYSLFSLRTWGWHLTTVLLHIAASLSVYALCRKLKLDHWAALIAAAIFAFHPIHIECAAWISAGSDSMVTVFYLLAFASLVNSRESDNKRRFRWKILSFLLLAAALLTKEMATTFAGVVFIYVWLTSEESVRYRRVLGAAISALPYAFLTVLYLLLRKTALLQTASIDKTHSIGDMIVTWPVVLFTYLRNLLYPVGLNALYYTPYIRHYSWREFLLPVLALTGVAGILFYWWFRSKDKVVGLAAIWMIVTLIPTLYLRIFTSPGFVRDRYVYLPSVGFAILVAKAIRMLPSWSPRLRASTLQVSTAIVLSLALLTGCATQQLQWGSNILLFSRAYRLDSRNDIAAINLVEKFIEKKDYADAYDIINRSFRVHDSESSVSLGSFYYSLAIIYFESGLRDKGRAALKSALVMEPRLTNSTRGLAGLIGVLGGAGEYENALTLCSKLLDAEPDLYTGAYNCGVVNYLDNRNPEAEKLLRRAVAIAPQMAPPHYFLGQLLVRTGRPVEAETCFRKAIALDATGGPYYALAQLLESSGRQKEAAEQYTLELRYNPRNAEAAQRLDALQANQGKF